ncbi:MAG: AtpZ/AtpI family protein [Elusimicrobia bacterium]|nr:AtpZ/AtpI family protein [Elusimicrobiota bacterium]
MKDTDEGWFKYAQLGLELAGAVLLGFYCGYKLDAYFGLSPWLMLAGSASGMAAGFYLVIRELPSEEKKKVKL